MLEKDSHVNALLDILDRYAFLSIWMLHIISIECSASESNAKRCPVWGSNSRPSDYETDALPTALTRLRRVTDLYLVVWPLNILVVKYDDNKEKSFLICLAPVAQSVSASYLYVSIDKEMRRSGVRASPGASCFLTSKSTSFHLSAVHNHYLYALTLIWHWHQKHKQDTLG